MEIVLEGPAKNALSTSVLTALRDQLEAAGDSPVLLTGAGDAFSAGLDLKEVVSLNHETMGTFLSLLQEVTYRLFQHPAPTVACVNGHAIAGGAILARACDHVVAEALPKAKIGLNEVVLGLRFPPRLRQMVEFRLPRRARFEVILGGTLFDPEGAVRVGLVDQVADGALAMARDRLELLAGHPRAAYAATKADLLGRVGAPDPDGDRLFLEQVVPVWTSPELKQRIRSFLGG